MYPGAAGGAVGGNGRVPPCRAERVAPEPTVNTLAATKLFAAPPVALFLRFVVAPVRFAANAAPPTSRVLKLTIEAASPARLRAVLIVS
jgi:hypothetical protein